MVKKTDEAVNDYPEDAPGEILAENDMQSLYQHIPAKLQNLHFLKCM